MRSLLWEWLRDVLRKATPVVEEEKDLTRLSYMERCQILYNGLDLEPFVRYKRTDSAAYYVQVVHPTIDHCIEDILLHIESIAKSSYVQPHRCNYTPINKTLNQFLLARDNCYLESTHVALLKLRDVVLDLCKHIDEAKHEVYETKSYNTRMLNSLFYILLELGNTITDVSTKLKSIA